MGGNYSLYNDILLYTCLVSSVTLKRSFELWHHFNGNFAEAGIAEMICFTISLTRVKLYDPDCMVLPCTSLFSVSLQSSWGDTIISFDWMWFVFLFARTMWWMSQRSFWSSFQKELLLLRCGVTDVLAMAALFGKLILFMLKLGHWETGTNKLHMNAFISFLKAF